MISMIVVNKNTNMRVCIMRHQHQVWGNIFLTSVGKKGMKDRGKDEKNLRLESG